MKGYYDNINKEYSQVSKAADDFTNSQKHIESNLHKLESALGCQIEQ